MEHRKCKGKKDGVVWGVCACVHVCVYVCVQWAHVFSLPPLLQALNVSCGALKARSSESRTKSQLPKVSVMIQCLGAMGSFKQVTLAGYLHGNSSHPKLFLPVGGNISEMGKGRSEQWFFSLMTLLLWQNVYFPWTLPSPEETVQKRRFQRLQVQMCAQDIFEKVEAWSCFFFFFWFKFHAAFSLFSRMLHHDSQ